MNYLLFLFFCQFRKYGLLSKSQVLLLTMMPLRCQYAHQTFFMHSTDYDDIITCNNCAVNAT